MEVRSTESFSRNATSTYYICDLINSSIKRVQNITQPVFESLCSLIPTKMTFNEPLTRERIQKMIRFLDPWREYTPEPSSFAKAIDMASRAAKHSDAGVRKDGLKLFQALLSDLMKHQPAHEPAIKAALVAVRDTNSGVRAEGVKVLKQLVWRWRYIPAYEPSVEAAQIVIRDPNIGVREQGLKLYTALIGIHYEPAYEPAAKGASVAVDDRANSSVSKASYELFDALFRANYEAYAEARAVARIISAHECAYTCLWGIRLYRLLVEKNYEPAYAEATEAAKTAAVSTNRFVCLDGVCILKELVRTNHADAYELLKAAAQEVALHENDKKLIEKTLQEYENHFSGISQK